MWRQQQQQQHPACAGMTVAALTHNIMTFLGENQWPITTKFCLKIMWTAVPVSLNEMRRSFQLRSDPVLSDKCSSSIACHAEINRHCPVNDSKFFTVVLKTFATNICFCCFYLFSDRNHINNAIQNINSIERAPDMSELMEMVKASCADT